MSEVRALNAEGLERFRTWLEGHSAGSIPPGELVSGDALSDQLAGADVDPCRQFGSRYEFGEYLVGQLGTARREEFLSPAGDGLWAWLTAVYFSQLGAKKKRQEHYLVDRGGHRGSLAYRHGARTSYELVAIHGASAQVCLSGPMQTFGELAEQFASRQTIVRNKAFFRTAGFLYLNSGRLRRGAGAKPKPIQARGAGDKTGFGSSRRLSIALQRLDLTWDTEEMEVTTIASVLPREFLGMMRPD